MIVKEIGREFYLKIMNLIFLQQVEVGLWKGIRILLTPHWYLYCRKIKISVP